MGTHVFDNIFVTGCSGALGRDYLDQALRSNQTQKYMVMVRSDKARRRISEYFAEFLDRLIFINGDLTSAELPQELMAQTGSLDSLLTVHIAADVSWSRDAADMDEMNVQGTIRLAEFTKMAAPKHQFIYVTTAYTDLDGWDYRTGYEITKAAAQRNLKAIFANTPHSSLACSLFCGREHDGSIARFNGIYPMVRYMAEIDPPFVVGRPDSYIDLVPVDWVARELLALTEHHLKGGEAMEVVAAAGEGSRITYKDAVTEARHVLDAYDRSLGLEPAAPLDVIPHRRWNFLKGAIKQDPRFAAMGFSVPLADRVINLYGRYIESDHVREPQNVTTSSPDPFSFLQTSIRFWVASQNDGFAGRREKLALRRKQLMEMAA